MPHFKKHIPTDFGNPEFFFNRIFTPLGAKYHVAVLDNERQHIFFNMEENEGKWYIAEPLKAPGWLLKIESELSDAIVSHKAVR